MNLPKLCILIPVFRDQHGLIRTLEVLAGFDDPFDIVVVDDGSPQPIHCDAQYGDHRVTLHRLDRNQGIEHALNAGLELILERGHAFVGRLDCGDLPLPGRFARQLDFLQANPKTGMVGTWARCVDDDGRYLFTLRFPTDHGAIMRYQRYVPALLHPTIMIRTEALREIGLYSDRYRTAEDYDLFIRMGQRWQLANIPEVLTEYIVSDTGTTAAKRKRNLVSRFRIQRDNFAPADIHSWAGLARTAIFMVIPFDWLTAIKKRAWK
ncbi:glycosyltransferase [Paracoccus sp. 1_MG-2023]|uniref:glycosyltransferase n=1 Tax=unclassified Paracoccus (in: a-proteobacteria) TaxID=2688777 RepID=UPI001C09F476|nr:MULTISPECIES: glycosyltransferase [unclassified Paracoccus (in: a-proteobacteria)]MBU2957920.1 glycosyltransferase [Paracoccus sp. C2R09]MDO6668887.1 glycosyltransferase [Paracoccus sp. 1_MG-2023]